MELARPDRRAVADDGDHLPEAPRLAGLDQRTEQSAPDAESLPGRCDVNRVLDRRPISRARPVRARVEIRVIGWRRKRSTEPVRSPLPELLAQLASGERALRRRREASGASAQRG